MNLFSKGRQTHHLGIELIFIENKLPLGLIKCILFSVTFVFQQGSMQVVLSQALWEVDFLLLFT
uniref:Uncharacterized protein n=1 Tax=Arundo donax TaxID=35708 RepID=A0A0A9DUF1_ARUDO